MKNIFIFIYIFVAIILYFIIISVYFLLRVWTTNNLETIFSLLQKKNLSANTISVGYDENIKKFKSYTLNLDYDGKNEKFIKIFTDNPLKLTGEQIYRTTADENKLIYDEFGFSVANNLIKLRCPPSTTGTDCTTKPLCTANQQFAPIDSFTFNSLNLYKGTTSEPFEYYHPLLKWDCKANILSQCTGEGNLKINFNTPNLDCEPFDICTIKYNGFIHNLKRYPSDVITPSMYFRCFNNKSIMHLCQQEDYFDVNVNRCIHKNK